MNKKIIQLSRKFLAPTGYDQTYKRYMHTENITVHYINCNYVYSFHITMNLANMFHWMKNKAV